MRLRGASCLPAFPYVRFSRSSWPNGLNFKAFHYQQAIGFKKKLAQQKSQKSGKELSKATLHATLTQLKRFFEWLALQPGYKSRLQYSDAEYFNLSENDMRVATATMWFRGWPSDQLENV
jgi:hypothetical protein